MYEKEILAVAAEMVRRETGGENPPSEWAIQALVEGEHLRWYPEGVAQDLGLQEFAQALEAEPASLAPDSLHEAVTEAARNEADRLVAAYVGLTAEDLGKTFYEVVSGLPAGEVYHHDVAVVETKEEAEAILSSFRSDLELELEGVEWLYGPAIHEFQYNGHYWPRCWNGFWSEPVLLPGRGPQKA